MSEEILLRAEERRESCKGAWRRAQCRVGRVLRGEREAAGVAGAHLAAAMGISSQFLHMLEAGTRDWSVERIRDFRAKLKKIS